MALLYHCVYSYAGFGLTRTLDLRDLVPRGSALVARTAKPWTSRYPKKAPASPMDLERCQRLLLRSDSSLGMLNASLLGLKTL